MLKSSTLRSCDPRCLKLRSTNEDESIVFVHGLTGNRVNTWTHQDPQIFWPKDLLAEDLETARIVTFGYDADIVNALDTASSNTLRDHGNSLALTLARWRVKTKSVGSVGTIPQGEVAD